MGKAERNSAHELLRIVAMFLIVWYHFVYYLLFLMPHDALYDYAFKPILPSMHIGVILFLLITGYYGINPTVRGFIRLLFITVIYYLPIEIVRCLHHDGDMIYTLMFMTHTPYWFIRTYLFFYLLSPIVNKYLASSSQRQINYMLAVLAIISLYFGTTNGDSSLTDGTNVVNFTFLYLLGYTIHRYQEQWERKGTAKMLFAFVLFNAAIIFSLYYWYGDETLWEMIWQLSFPYCGPILIMDAVLLFMFFTQLHFYSKIINRIASSMFAVYLIHAQPAFHKYVMIPITCCLSEQYPSPPHVLIFAYAAVSSGVVMVCMGIDKLLTPIWILGDRIGICIQESRIIKRYE